MFSIDEKVVCIHVFSVRKDAELGVVMAKKGEMYTIRTIEKVDGDIYLRFHELRNPVVKYRDGYSEAQFWDGRFRKLDYDFVEEVMAEIKEQVNTE